MRGALLGSIAGTGFDGSCRLGRRSFEAPPGKRRIFGYLMIDLSKSISTRWISEKAQPLSCPAYLPGEVDAKR